MDDKLSAMSKKSKKNKVSQDRPPENIFNVAFAIGVPLLGALFLGQAIIGLSGASDGSLASSSIVLAGLGLISMFYGMQKYGTGGMGLRGGRPMFAGLGFTFLGWVAILILRIFYIDIDEGSLLVQALSPIFFYLLIFEAFAVQLWAFSLVFKSVSDMWGGLTAAVVSGLLFAGVAFFFFQEARFLEPLFGSVWLTIVAILYMATWGILYGMIRLRTGSILGIVIVQAMQSLTVWELIPPFEIINETNYNPLFFTVTGIFYAVLIWRLWPTELDDYRI
ncbi:MAG: hypothetical protein ACI9EW_002712 [Cellvibrionaceae bacterium]|jgi:hypothetical protein